MWDPYSIQPYGGARCFVVFVDDASRLVRVFIMKSRTDIYEAFSEYRVSIKRQRGTKLKAMQIDGAKEYI